ncbi:hypothetical protein JIR001_18800 [Polycladomyces abyssicola]|uniref:Carbohydrate kinase FGGY N-terminal domain-containing protein n=1 Tax=Polycladomyces abyssicola TaxID=1125966 RepID=A0A8D5ZNM4_9BACL|nr:hypothetical protein JIR001_18800 [Polycladomyces abyssicola]
MSFVIGVDLGTSAVKTVIVNREGEVCYEVSKSYPLHQTSDFLQGHFYLLG